MSNIEPPSEDYDDLTVDEVKTRVESDTLDPIDVADYERAHKQRVTLLRWLDNFVNAWISNPETVRVAPMRKRRVATFWIDDDDLYEPMEVHRTPKVEEAIEEGDLQVIDDD